MDAKRFRLAIVGGYRRDFYITADGRTYAGIAGGHGVYAAVGARVWSDEVALLTRIGPIVSGKDLDQLERAGIHTFKPSRLQEDFEQRRFFAYTSPETRVGSNPAAHFLRVGHPFPKELLDYPAPETEEAGRILGGPDAFLPDDLPAGAALPGCIHVCPANFRTHLLLPARLREMGVRVITLDPAAWYEGMDYASAVRDIVSGLDAFVPSAEEAREILRPRELGPFETAEALASLGCRYLAVKHGAGGSCVWDRERGRGWHIPAYPARVRDITGAGDAYCGGFLAGLSQADDPVEAALMGSVAASLAIEGSGALYPLDALPGLARARLEALRPLVHQA